jgi:hypothetical protein
LTTKSFQLAARNDVVDRARVEAGMVYDVSTGTWRYPQPPELIERIEKLEDARKTKAQKEAEASAEAQRIENRAKELQSAQDFAALHAEEETAARDEILNVLPDLAEKIETYRSAVSKRQSAYRHAHNVGASTPGIPDTIAQVAQMRRHEGDRSLLEILDAVSNLRLH